MKPIIDKLKEMSEHEWIGFWPLKLGLNADMSAIWKLLGVAVLPRFTSFHANVVQSILLI